MPDSQTDSDHSWARAQISQYQALYPEYLQLADTLRHVLDRAARPLAPDAVVQARAKAVASFAEKIQRKRDKYDDPVHQFTDLCGARVITHTHAEVQAVCEFIKQNFVVDEDNSQDVSERLQPAEFGYRSVHYIVQFKPGVFPNKEIDVEIPHALYPLKAEIQVRTLLEHAWASFGHDRFYKSAFTIPAKWQRELAELAALLENVDADFARIQNGLQSYAASYGAYLTPGQIDAEIQKLDIVLEYDSKNLQLAHRIGKLAITRENWDKAIAVLSNYAEANYQPILRDLGIALTKKHAHDPDSDEFRRGQEYLERASAAEYHDADALASYASTWRKRDEARARELYRKAFETDPSDPYALNMFLQYEITARRDPSLVALMHPALDAAIVRCREQIEVGINMPWAYFNLGKFQLLLGQAYAALAAYAKGIQASSAAWMVQSSLDAMERLGDLSESLPGYEWVRRLLLLGWTVKLQANEDALRAPVLEETPEQKMAREAELQEVQERRERVVKRVNALATPNGSPLREPIVILAGGTDTRVQDQMQTYRGLLREAFKTFSGTLISGGTTSGIAGLAGELQAAYPEHLTTIGYLPAQYPEEVATDKRYSETRTSGGEGFSPLEPLQYWTDLIAAGVAPNEVKLLGINGGEISAAEFRIALALGATVGVLFESGRAASKLAPDEDWKDSPRLLALPSDSKTLRAFVGPRQHSLPDTAREELAQLLHAAYQVAQTDRSRTSDPSLKDWKGLSENLRESNRQQADDMIEKVRRLGFEVQTVTDRPIVVNEFTPAEVEDLAEMEHGRWVVERMMDGWKLSDQRDPEHKLSPYLVPWSELDDDIKEWDRRAVRQIPTLLARAKLEVRKLDKAYGERGL